MSECHEEVSIDGRPEPCERPAVAWRFDPESGEPYPVCVRHVRRDMVSLDDLIVAVRIGDAEAIARQMQRNPMNGDGHNYALGLALKALDRLQGDNRPSTGGLALKQRLDAEEDERWARSFAATPADSTRAVGHE